MTEVQKSHFSREMIKYSPMSPAANFHERVSGRGRKSDLIIRASVNSPWVLRVQQERADHNLIHRQRQQEICNPPTTPWDDVLAMAINYFARPGCS
jgi:hypothetical protein